MTSLNMLPEWLAFFLGVFIFFILYPHPRHLDSLWIRCKDWRCVVLREIDFLLKICDRFLACFTCGLKLLDEVRTVTSQTFFLAFASEPPKVASWPLSAEFCSLSQTFRYATEQQAHNQLGTLEGAKGFLRGAQIFERCPTVLEYVQHIFIRGCKFFFHPPGYGPAEQ